MAPPVGGASKSHLIIVMEWRMTCVTGLSATEGRLYIMLF